MGTAQTGLERGKYEATKRREDTIGALMAGLHWRDSDYRLRPGVWHGLLVTADDAVRPGFEVRVCDPLCLRLDARDSPTLWARVEDDYWGYELLRARRDQSLNVLPPIPLALVHKNAECPRDEAIRAWAHTYAEMLSVSATSPISAGSWFLRWGDSEHSTSDLSSGQVGKILNQRSNGYVLWDFGNRVYPITLRDFSSPEDGRVKAWRKHARAGSLPPVLLYWVSGLAAYVVLDGHDRLLAAFLEGVGAPALRLEAFAEQSRANDETFREVVLEQVSKALAAASKERSRPAAERLARARRLLDVDSANRLLLAAFVPRQGIRPTRARPLPGGRERWAAEVRSELSAQGIRDSGLLEGLAGSSQRST